MAVNAVLGAEGGSSTMQHQRAIVGTDETVIDWGERVHLEVNAAMAGQSRLLSAEPSAALTKSCSRSRRAARIPRALPVALGQRLPCAEAARGPAGAFLLCGRPPAPRARSRPAARAAVLRSSAVLGARIGWALLQWGRSLGAQHRCSASLLAWAAAGMSRDARLRWQL